MSQAIKSYACSQPKLAEYVMNCFKPQDDILKEIRDRAAAEKLPNIHIGQMDGLHLEILIRASGARLVVEIGALAGYSGVCIARALPENGHLHTFELYEKNAKICAQSYKQAGVQEKITIHQGQALDNLKKIESLGPFDAVFLDADKFNYPKYLDWALKNLRVGGLLIADNTFAWGLVLQNEFDNESQRKDAEGIRTFNDTVANHPQWRATLLPTGEGLTVAVKTSNTN